MINRLFKPANAKACVFSLSLSLSFFLLSTLKLSFARHLHNFFVNHVSEETTEYIRKHLCVRRRNYWFLIAWLITKQRRMLETFVISLVIGANTCITVESRCQENRYVFCVAMYNRGACNDVSKRAARRKTILRWCEDRTIESLECF